jgi:nucleoid DNA-binding protein
MNTEVVQIIKDLLYERQSVVIPGLGRLSVTYKSATIDHVQGMLHPPASQLAFTMDQSANDQDLQMALQENCHWSAAQAKEMLNHFSNTVRTALDKREIVSLPGIGRIYRDFEGRDQFFQDNTNFNLDTFGLPVVQFYPILRQEAPHRPGPSGTQTKTSSGTKDLTNWLQRSMPLLVSMALVIIVASIYFLQNDFSDQSPRQEARKTLPVNRVNMKPLPAPLTEAPGIIIETTEIEPQEEEWFTEEEEAVVEEDKTDAATTHPDQKEGIIIMGAFSELKNAELAIQSIYENGYDAYSDQKGKMTRVGVRFAYKQAEELNVVLKDVKNRFNKKAWILKAE